MARKKRGGARPNAGRPKGSRNSRSYKIAADALEEGRARGKLTPIEIMLENMWDAYDKATTAKGTLARIEARQRAQECAKDAAPYCHTRLGTLEVSGIDGDPIENKIVVEFVRSQNSKK
jgi:hypothetical protein